MVSDQHNQCLDLNFRRRQLSRNPPKNLNQFLNQNRQRYVFIYKHASSHLAPILTIALLLPGYLVLLDLVTHLIQNLIDTDIKYTENGFEGALGGRGPRVKSQIFELLALGDSSHQGDSKMRMNHLSTF